MLVFIVEYGNSLTFATAIQCTENIIFQADIIAFIVL